MVGWVMAGRLSLEENRRCHIQTNPRTTRSSDPLQGLLEPPFLLGSATDTSEEFARLKMPGRDESIAEEEGFQITKEFLGDLMC